MLTIPLYPWIIKKQYDLFTADFKSYLLVNNQIDQNYTYEEIIYQVAFINNNIIDFIINNDNYSYEIRSDIFYKYTHSNRKITEEPFIYLNIDSNDNISNNTSYNTSKLTNNFSFKLVPIALTDDYVYYKSIKQYILKKISNIQSIDNLTLCLSDSTNKKLTNNHINTELYFCTNNRSYIMCNCTDNLYRASCYCKYIRHPLHKNNQIDIAFKIGLINNELIANIYH